MSEIKKATARDVLLAIAEITLKNDNSLTENEKSNILIDISQGKTDYLKQGKIKVSYQPISDK